MLGHHIELEALQAGQETPGERDGIEAIEGEDASEQLSLIGEKIDIEAQIVAHQNSAINKLQEVGKHFPGKRGSVDHILRDAGKFGNKGRNTAARIDKGLK